MAVVLGNVGAAGSASIGTFNPAMLVHGEQGVSLPARSRPRASSSRSPRSPASTTRARAPWSSARRTATLVADGQPLFTTTMSALFIRGEGGWGGDRGPSSQVRARPTGDPTTRSPTRPARPGPALPALGRPQPAALRPQVRRAGRLRPADPARALHLRVHRPGAAARAVRRRPGPVPVDERPLLSARCSRARPLTVSMWVDGRRRGRVPDRRAATAGSCSTPARPPSASLTRGAPVSSRIAAPAAVPAWRNPRTAQNRRSSSGSMPRSAS